MNTKPDIPDARDVEELLHRFYVVVLEDAVLREHFAHLDLSGHIPRIAAFWNMVLFGMCGFEGDVMGKHIALHGRILIMPAHVDRWLALFSAAVDEGYAGPTRIPPERGAWAGCVEAPSRVKMAS